MSKDSSPKYYQNNKERQKKKARESYLKKIKKKSNSIAMNDTKIYQKMTKKACRE